MEQKFPQQNSIEQTRQNLAEKVKFDLEKYQNEVDKFSMLTTSKYDNGQVSTNDQLDLIKYDNRYDKEFEFKNFKERSNSYTTSHETGYVYDIPNKMVTFVGYMGRCLHTPDRPGNAFFVTIKFKKEAEHVKELIDPILSLFSTLKNYETDDKEDDLKNILKQGIPVLEAFEDFSNKLPSNGARYGQGSTVSKLLKEYKELLALYK